MNAMCNFCKFCFVLFVPLLFALHSVVHAAFALLVDKAGVLHNCRFCSCNQASVFADAKCNYSPSNPTYLVILRFFAQKSGSAPLRTRHSLVLLTTKLVPRLQLHCCIQRHSACLPAILAPNLRHFLQLIEVHTTICTFVACFATPKAFSCKFSQLHWDRACAGAAAWLLLLLLHCRCLMVLLVNLLHTSNSFSTEHGLTQV